MFWDNVTSIVVVLIPTVGIVATAAVSWWATSTKRDVDAAAQFAEFVAKANGRPTDGRDGVGLAEQLAHIELVASLADRHKGLREPAIAMLTDVSANGLADTGTISVNSRVIETASRALDRVAPDSRGAANSKGPR